MTQEPFIVHTEPLDAIHLEARLSRLRTALDACPTEVPASLAGMAKEAGTSAGHASRAARRRFSRASR